MKWVPAATAALTSLSLLAFAPLASATGPAPAARDLKVESTVRPLDVDDLTPTFSWQDSAPQVAYQVQVRRLGQSSLDWDSGQVSSAEETGIEYAGDALRSDADYEWRVRLWGPGSGSGQWSSFEPFSTGLLKASDWSGDWIGRDLPAPGSKSRADQQPAPLLRKAFTLRDKKVTRARLHVAGLGYYVAYLNGKRIGDHQLDPGFTDYNDRVLYESYDVKSLLDGNANALGVELGSGYFGAAGNDDVFGYGSVSWNAEPKLRVQLDVTYADGSTQHLVTDPTWKVADGPTVKNGVRTGESYDATKEIAGWSGQDFDDSAWQTAKVVTAPSGRLVAQNVEPIRIVRDLKPSSVTELADGSRVYKFPEVTAGWSRITVDGAAGTTLTLNYGEKLKNDGSVDSTITNYSNGTQTDSYTLKGGGPESWEPQFTYHGFQYVQVRSSAAMPELQVTGRVVHTDLASIGSFDSSNELFNTYNDAQRRTILNNVHSIPTDTPMYEKQGWTADGYLFSDSAMMNFDAAKFYTKWLNDFSDSVRADGTVPIYLPSPNAFIASFLTNDPLWSGVYIPVAWNTYRYYGNREVLVDNYPGMKAWMDLMVQKTSATGYLHKGFTFGDWLSPTGTGSDNAIVASAALANEARQLAQIAHLLGHEQDAAGYTAFAGKVVDAINASYLDVTAGQYRMPGQPYRQTSQLIMLAYNLVPAASRQAVLTNLVADIKARDNHFYTGSTGTKLILPVLTENGYVDLANKLANQTTYPSWGYWFKQLGATTMWESFEANTRSHDHAFLGTVDDWLYQDLAGIKPASAGYADIQVAPKVPAGLEHTSASIDTPRGTVTSSWRQTGSRFLLQVKVPDSSTATVVVPRVHADWNVKAPAGATLISQSDADVTYRVAGGVWNFAADDVAAQPAGNSTSPLG